MINQIFNGDCLEVMEKLIKQGVRVDFILTDPPYGMLNGINIPKGNYKEGISWDNEIPINPMFECMEKILREKGTAILFSQGDLTARLRTQTIHNLPYLYNYYWLKNGSAHGLCANKAPLNHIEELSVFFKEFDKYSENPLRKYGQELRKWIVKKSNTNIEDALKKQFGNRNGVGIFYQKCSQFGIPTKETYQSWIDDWQIDKMPEFISYDDLVRINKRYVKIFNLEQGKKSKSSVLKYARPSGEEQGYHPTQKPVALLEDLILTYTNEGDTVLDFTMGSGSTGIAAINTNRYFIGVEKDKEIFQTAKQRIESQIGAKT